MTAGPASPGRVAIIVSVHKKSDKATLAPTGEALDMAQALAQELTRFPQACMRADHLSARLPSQELAAALRREWRSAKAFLTEGRDGAQRFASGLGRSGDFSQI